MRLLTAARHLYARRDACVSLSLSPSVCLCVSIHIHHCSVSNEALIYVLLVARLVEQQPSI